MKKILLISSLKLFALCLCSQVLYVPGGNTNIGDSGNGNVGIGVASPTARLQIGDNTVNANNYLLFGRRINSYESSLPYIGHDSFSGAGSDLGIGSTSSLSGINFYTGNGLPFAPDNLRMRINQAGNVGINTTDMEAYKLSVKGATRVGGNVTFARLRIEATDESASRATTTRLELHGYEGRAKGIVITDQNTDHKWFVGEGYNYAGFGIGYNTVNKMEYAENTKFLIKPDGNIGIGISNPVGNVHLRKDDPSLILNDINSSLTSAFAALYMGSDVSGSGAGLRHSWRLAYDYGGLSFAFGYSGLGSNFDDRKFFQLSKTGNLTLGKYGSGTTTGNPAYLSAFESTGKIVEVAMGAGGGVDADQLDGQEGAHYLNYNNLTNAPNLLWEENNTIAYYNMGSVGIGTNDPGSYKLAVEGKVGAREVKVTPDAWADYVFDKDYPLRDLENLEKYINENHHLPNIPSEEEVLAEGIQLGEMNGLLLSKIEELTLHLIAINKEVQELQRENQELAAKVSKD